MVQEENVNCSANEGQDSISIYIHWPFCISKCPYCDFNSHVLSDYSDDFIASYLKEINYFSFILNGRKIRSIYFGGGTPSLAPPRFFEAVIREIDKISAIGGEIEITMEANPSSSEYSKFIDFRNAGINRVSIGIQSLNEDELKFLGRAHNKAEALAAIEAAARVFPRYSFDLMYALPGQSLEGWQTALKSALSLASGHVSLYQLTIEKGTKFYSAHNKGHFKMPSLELSADFYNMTCDIAAENGLVRYEVSNYANPGMESAHNINYWEYGDFLGIGPGAHGRYVTDEGIRYSTVMLHKPDAWLKEVRSKSVGLQRIEIVDENASYEEMIMMGLRTRRGIPISSVRGSAKVEELISIGMLELSNDSYIAPSNAGFLVLNELIRLLVI